MLNDDDSWFAYPQARLIHIAGMVRHLAIQMMSVAPPENVADVARWVESFVAGHYEPGSDDQPRFSYLPLPSIGHVHVDQDVRRVIVAAPTADRHLLEHLSMYLSGQQLIPSSETDLRNPPTLRRMRPDGVALHYLRPAQTWASVTPVILPGHDDHKPAKTRKLIEKALRQSGVEQPCEYEWSAYPAFRKSLSAHKYDRRKRPTGYIRPNHLLNQTAIHLKLKFPGKVKVAGPLSIGSGRYCGLGLMAAVRG